MANVLGLSPSASAVFTAIGSITRAAAWFDIGEAGLVRLPQQYRRIADDRYWYSSPTGGYEAVLEMAGNGFVRLYPELWEMEDLQD